MLEVPIGGKTLDFLIAKFRTVIGDQLFWNGSEFHPRLINYSFYCLPVNLKHFEEIGLVIHRVRNVCCLMTDRLAASFWEGREDSTF